ncbi:MAG: hypothetical protein Q8S75_10815, partial [Nitrospirota bacterium]|nr:hypothetical protein [Nitrospirota bacterium]
MIPVLAPLPQEVAVVMALFQEFLAAHADPDGGQHLHDLYADDAPVAFDGRLCRKGDTDREAFAQAHRHACTQGIGKLPVFERVDLLAGNVETDASLAVGWFNVFESGDGRAATVGLGA